MADGVFDPLHVGHIRYLKDAAAFGTPLAVRVAPDSAIREKGREPFQTRDERAIMVLALGMVDRVCLQNTLAEAIRDVQPHFLVKGDDWRGKLPVDVLKACQDVGAQIVYSPVRERTSTERLRA